jgi:tetratricopeptide (TPR) repeat protein
MSDEHHKLDLGDKPEKMAAPSGWDYLSDGGCIRCVFSTAKRVKMGMSANTGKQDVRVLWFVEQVAPEKFEARRINAHNVPAGESEFIPMHKLVNEFTPQIAFYEEDVLPAMLALEDKLDQGDDLRQEGKLYSAEMEYGDALKMDERNVRALFGLGLIFAGRKEVDRTRGLLSELINVKAAFVGKNQHLFNEFGIALRKAGLFDEAVAYYSRALEYVDDDEHLYYNLARSHYENGSWEECIESLLLSNKLNPDLALSCNLFELIVGLANDKKRLARYGKPPVPPEVADLARKALSMQSSRTTLDEAPIIPSEIGRARYGGDSPSVEDLFGDLKGDKGN